MFCRDWSIPTPKIWPITFDESMSKGRDDAVLVSSEPPPAPDVPEIAPGRGLG